MSWWELIVVAVALGTDAFSVSIAAGCTMGRPRFGPTFRMAAYFGFFQFMMPILGWLAGAASADFVGVYGKYIAAGLLAIVAANMLYESLKKKDEQTECPDYSTGVLLLSMAVATSIDALLVGVGIGMLGRPIIIDAFVIGVVAAAMTVLGIQIGCKVGELFGGRAEIIGAAALGAIALSVVLR